VHRRKERNAAILDENQLIMLDTFADGEWNRDERPHEEDEFPSYWAHPGGK